MLQQPQVRIGEIVLYTGVYGVQTLEYPALITSIEVRGEVNLAVFHDHKAQAAYLIGYPTSVPYSVEPKMHTWRFMHDHDGVDMRPFVQTTQETSKVIKPGQKKAYKKK